MVEIEFPYSKKRFYLPSTLGECTADEFKRISILLLDYFSGVINYEDLKLQITASLLGYELNHKSTQEGLANLILISETVDRYFDLDSENRNSINLEIYDDKIPFLHTFFRKYYSPGESYEKMTYGQYADASRFFMMFDKDHNTDYLYTMLAILYTRRNKAYNSKQIDKRVVLFKKYIHPGVAFGVYLLFAAFQKNLSTAEINWRGETLNLSTLFEGATEQSSEMPGLGPDSLVYTLAEMGALGKAEEVRSTNFWEIMLLMYEMKKRDVEREKQQNHASNK